MKTEQQVKDRLKDGDARLSEIDPDYPDMRESDNPEISYLRGYLDALEHVLTDIPVPVAGR